MADTFDPKKAIEEYIAKQAAAQGGLQTQIQMVDVLKRTDEQYNQLNSSMQAILGPLREGITSAERFISSITESNAQTVRFNTISKETTLGLALLSTTFIGASESMREFGQGSLVGSRSAKQLTTDINSLQKAFSQLPVVGPLMEKTVGPFLKIMAGMAPSTDNVRAMETQLVGLSARFGGFGDSATRLNFIENLDRNFSHFNTTMTNLSLATGLSREEVSEYAKKLMSIPSVIATMNQGLEIGGKQMTRMEAAMRVSRGTTGDLDDAIKAMNYQFKSFGKINEVAYDMLARTHSVAQQLGQDFKDLEAPIFNIARQFRVFGDNTDSAIRLVGNLSRALMQTGLGIEPTTKIIEGITSSIAQMDIAQKAFLSSQTGGAGGLRGAYEIDMLLRQGEEGVAAVYEKMEQALRQQFGGEIVTVEQASQDDVAASQMTKQLAFVMEGPFGKLAQSTGEAYKLFEAFSKGTTPTAEVAAGATGEAMAADEKIQVRQQTSLDTIATLAKHAVFQRDLLIAQKARGIVGGDNSRARQFMRTYAEGASQRAMQAMGVNIKSPDEEWKKSLEAVKRGVIGAPNEVGGGVIGTATGSLRQKMAENQALEGQKQTGMAAPAPIAPVAAPAGARGVMEPARTATPESAATGAAPPTLLKFEPSVIRLDIGLPGGHRQQRDLTIQAVTGSTSPAE